MKCSLIRKLAVVVLIISLFQLVACGTLLYPERRGQKSGEVDIKIAVLDGIGLLFGIIPGVVAFAVDYSNGAIYLPAGRHNHILLNNRTVDIVYVNPSELTPSRVKEVVSKEMGLPQTINWGGLKTEYVQPDQMASRLVYAQATGYAQ